MGRHAELCVTPVPSPLPWLTSGAHSAGFHAPAEPLLCVSSHRDSSKKNFCRQRHVVAGNKTRRNLRGTGLRGELVPPKRLQLESVYELLPVYGSTSQAQQTICLPSLLHPAESIKHPHSLSAILTTTTELSPASSERLVKCC